MTLIETIIYIALLAIVIGGGVVAAYQIIQVADASYAHIILQEEANFLLRKIDWALTGATLISTNSSTLAVLKPTLGTLIFSLHGTDLTLQRGESLPNILNSSSIVVSAVSFLKTKGVYGKPDSVTINFTLATMQSGKPATQNFSITKYLQ